MSLQEVRARVAAAEARAARAPGSTVLIAVSKVQPIERVEAALAAGQRVFGENRVQEAAGKWPALRERWPGVELHLIGPLQTNKARQAVELFDAIQTLDRPKLAARIADAIQAVGRAPILFVQVNTGREPQKAGVSPEEAAAFIRECRVDLGLDVSGVMAIPPAEDDPAPHFTLLRAIGEAEGLPLLSMGMSGDFEAAIEAGATHVRVGSAIFGERVAPA